MSKINNSDKNIFVHLASGGVAGCCEALVCHPLDTIKVKLQLSSTSKSLNFINVGTSIVKNEGFFGLYKGLGAVMTGIVPKMAIRFSSFELYKSWLTNKKTGTIKSSSVFLAGLGAGITESIAVVTPMDVIKIRLQSQKNQVTSIKYKNTMHCAIVIIKEEGIKTLYKGMLLTCLRQSTNQAANFTVYQYIKNKLHEYQPTVDKLPWYQYMITGFISGSCGPLFNAPIDTIKTRIQQEKYQKDDKAWLRFIKITNNIINKEGYSSLYKGLIPRILRVAPGQAITFMVYEFMYKELTTYMSSHK